jgi:prenylcysteine oxidase / farnesylcysteine lyase
MSFPPVKLDRGFYYVNAFEPYVIQLGYIGPMGSPCFRFISTMETETIAARNVVDLLLNEEFNSGVCGSRISGSETTQHYTTREASSNFNDFVLGWDC